MAVDLPIHRFDESSAERYQPNPAFAKTAVLVAVAEPDAITTIDAPFGRQTFHGPFYVVAGEDGAYGSAQAEFEAMHHPLGDGRWRKTAGVLAYRATEPCIVETFVGDVVEATTTAEPGDWIVRQPGGEVMVVPPTDFDDRYVPSTA